MTWVLIVLYFSGGPTAVAMHDFADQKACETAAAKVMALQSEMKGIPQVKAVCTPKSS